MKKIEDTLNFLYHKRAEALTAYDHFRETRHVKLIALYDEIIRFIEIEEEL